MPARIRERETRDEQDVRQTHSVARRTTKQEQILLGLGLKGIGKTKTLEDTPAVRGMIAKVSHLISVTEG
jgi:large subunit ribosomal protein L30